MNMLAIVFHSSAWNAMERFFPEASFSGPPWQVSLATFLCPGNGQCSVKVPQDTQRSIGQRRPTIWKSQISIGPSHPPSFSLIKSHDRFYDLAIIPATRRFLVFPESAGVSPGGVMSSICSNHIECQSGPAGRQRSQGALRDASARHASSL
jgi:hypothetical protein